MSLNTKEWTKYVGCADPCLNKYHKGEGMMEQDAFSFIVIENQWSLWFFYSDAGSEDSQERTWKKKKCRAGTTTFNRLLDLNKQNNILSLCTQWLVFFTNEWIMFHSYKNTRCVEKKLLHRETSLWLVNETMAERNFFTLWTTILNIASRHWSRIFIVMDIWLLTIINHFTVLPAIIVLNFLCLVMKNKIPFDRNTVVHVTLCDVCYGKLHELNYWN